MHYYSFYPTNPFVQTGSLQQPVVYWLSVQASLPTGELFGWKTSTNHFNDDAVFGLEGISPSGAVANWPMDEGAGTIVYDTTPNANNGGFDSPLGAPPTWVAGHESPWALQFPGGPQSYNGAGVRVPHSSSLNITGPFAIQAWIKADPGQHYHTIVDKMFSTGAPTSKGYTFYLTGGQLRLSVYAGGGVDGDVFGTSYVTNSQWHLVEGGYDGSSIYVKVDGRVESRVAWTNPPAANTTNLCIGKRLCGWGGYMPFKGVIDAVTVTTNLQQKSWQWTELVDPRYGDSMDLAFKLTTVSASEDFGDAPDPTFPTLLASNGARHKIVPGVRLGALIDAEFNGQPNATATGDDSNNLADEDGVVLNGSLMVPGDWATATVTASTNGRLSAWVDFQADGSWATPGDQIFTNLSLLAGVSSLNFYVPTNAAQGSNVFVRFRFSTTPATNFTGLALDGEVEDYRWLVAEVDYGDAPDPTFPTLHASNGARHWRGPNNLRLGNLWDREINGQPNAFATGDDLANLADEDGVKLLTAMLPGSPAWIQVTPSAPNTFLSAWIDFGADGSWAQPTDQIFSGFMFTAAGPTNLSFIVPAGAAAGSNVFARFRYSTAPVLSYTNQVGPPCMTPNGEVEDYLWRVSQLDYGDAPDPTYPTWLTNNGASHLIVPGFCLGTNISPEWDGQPNATATGDTFDDGVFFVTPLTLASQACVNVFLTAGTNGGKLDAWIDFNRNGTWDAAEQVFSSKALVPGLNTNLCFSVPASAALGQTFARFRLSSVGGLPVTGYAADGEVEDYRVRITQRPLATNCVITNIYFQSMYYGWNEPSVYGSTNIAADDWVCTTTNPVTAIRWWGSFLNWRSDTPPALPPAFQLAIWDDVPASGGGFSHPGRVLWVIECTNYTWQFAGWDFDPRAQTNETCFRFEQQLAPAEWFYQTNRPSGSNIYWLSIAAMLPQGPQPGIVYGWKTRPRAATSPAPDDAVRIFNPTAPYLGALYVQGQPIFWPDRTNSWDLAFELISSYTELVTKWEQPPDLSNNGLDVNDTHYVLPTNLPPYLLADDFKCRSTGPLTDITIWGSWTNDYETPSNLWFTVSIHADIPAFLTNHSRPGPLLWQQTFLPGQFGYQWVQLPYPLYEGWLTPPTNYFWPADHACFQVDFHVQTNAFVQTNGTIYWLDVQAHLPQPLGQQWPVFGWKTTPREYRWNDDAVWVNAVEPYNGNAWKDLHYPPGHPYYLLPTNSIDLAFRLTSLESIYQLKWSQPPVPSANNRYVTVEWNAETGIQYQLLATPSLGIDNGTDIVWSPVGPIVVGPAYSMSDANATAAQRYYRVLVP